MNIRRFFAFLVIACWIPVTILLAGDFLVEDHANFTAHHEARLHAPESDSLPHLEAENKAGMDYIDYHKSHNEEMKWVFRIWAVLTLIGAALFAGHGRRYIKPL